MEAAVLGGGEGDVNFERSPTEQDQVKDSELVVETVSTHENKVPFSGSNQQLCTKEEEGSVIFHNVSYLGAAKIQVCFLRSYIICKLNRMLNHCCNLSLITGSQ